MAELEFPSDLKLFEPPSADQIKEAEEKFALGKTKYQEDEFEEAIDLFSEVATV